MSSPKARGALLAAALLVIAGGLAFRNQAAILSRLYEHRLADDSSTPDEAVGAARALRRMPDDPPRARLRFLLARGFDLNAAAASLGNPPSTGDAAQDLVKITEEERRLAGLVGALTRDHPDVPIAFAEKASDAAVRARALDALTHGAADSRSLAAATARLEDPYEAVRLAAFTAGDTITRRMADPAAREAFLAQATQVKGLSLRALDAAEAHNNPRAIPVLIAFLASPHANEAEKGTVVDHVKRLAGEKHAASAPKGIDAAPWKEWWAKNGAAILAAPR